MGLFHALVRTTLNVAALPVTIAVDAVNVIADAGSGVAPRTRKLVETIETEASTDE